MKPCPPPFPDLSGFDDIIDVRTPDEFAEDHIPGAINCPVLDNAQRIEVGTLYKQVSSFEAKKIGAAMVSENIARHLRATFRDRPRTWKPLIYCWRGGDRSGAMTTVFRAIGWRATQLDGGYKSWRKHVVATLATLPASFRMRIISGATGSAKTRILQEIGKLGEQILDLETLASHKGSVLGVLPGQPQPSQKHFETTLLQALASLDPARPVYVEAESRKIGNLQVPEALIATMRQGECLQVEAPLDARVAFLLVDYDYFLTMPEFLTGRLDALQRLQSRETLLRWRSLISSGDWPALVRELLHQHYDPLYRHSQNRHFAGRMHPRAFATEDLSPTAIAALATAIAQSRTAQMA